MQNLKRVFIRTAEGKVFECFTDKNREEIMQASIKHPKLLFDERFIRHIKRCVVQPHVSGFLDEKIIRLFYEYSLINNDEYQYFLDSLKRIQLKDDA